MKRSFCDAGNVLFQIWVVLTHVCSLVKILQVVLLCFVHSLVCVLSFCKKLRGGKGKKENKQKLLPIFCLFVSLGHIL